MSSIQLLEINHEGTTESIHVEKMSDGIFKCHESCLFIDGINYGCEIKAIEKDGKLNFIEIYKESPFQKFQYIWSSKIIESDNCKKMMEKIIEMEGYWESAMGGVFIIHLPKNKASELENLLEFLKAE